jgi:uncharacterized protein (DUF2132 family)
LSKYLPIFIPTLSTEQKNNPLHGKTLEMILNHLVAQYGWEEMGERIRINCFVTDPSIKSSLKFLRATPWARKKVEDLYLESMTK